MKFKPKGTYLYICRDEPSEEAVESSHDKTSTFLLCRKKMASASSLKTSPIVDKTESIKGQTLRHPLVSTVRCQAVSPSSPGWVVSNAGFGSVARHKRLILTAKVLMAMHPSPLFTTNKDLALQNDKCTKASIPNGLSALALKEAARGLDGYAAISQVWNLLFYLRLSMELTKHSKFTESMGLS
ncbi:Fructose-bisphosphate aldolase [Melia azedarach]|uniref:Fructose-bisphosphate aldolase n=1 Tax=Melia azedarach TaxID=155640 RepID=A0ACC1XSV5_MELAZ|nr:Fructose-bisphosphate aldolase [Melia azedarach]